jgi:electron transfer flavoprotein alpha subunit
LPAVKVAVLVKQVPRFELMELGADGRLVRDGLELELNPYCRRAVSQGVELAEGTGGTATVITLGPPAAEDVLREAIAWGATDGVLVSDPAFAGSDTLATARALAAVLERQGPYDLILAGRNSVDADTGQVGPEVAQLLDLPFLTGVKSLDVGDGELKVVCEEDDGESERIARLPVVVSTAERLIEPAKVDVAGRAAVDGGRIRRLSAADLGPGPWGQAGSPTSVGATRVLENDRACTLLTGSPAEQVEAAIGLLVARGALAPDQRGEGAAALTPSRGPIGPAIAVVAEPHRLNVTSELLGTASSLALRIDGHVVAVAPGGTGADALELAARGADAVVSIAGVSVEEDVAEALVPWVRGALPWAILLPSTTWGREVGSRIAACLGAGLTGDAIGFDLSAGAHTPGMQLVAWKPAFGGRLIAAVRSSTVPQMATVRPGVLRPAIARARTEPCPEVTITASPRGRVQILSSTRNDDLDRLATASRVVCVGAGVPPDRYRELEPLLHVLGAELAATRKVTDKAWQPRARQIGITGRSVAPRLYVGIGLSGKFNHAVGIRAAATVVAINSDPAAPVWEHCDIGLVADWRDVVPLLVRALGQAATELGATPSCR